MAIKCFLLPLLGWLCGRVISFGPSWIKPGRRFGWAARRDDQVIANGFIEVRRLRGRL